MSGLDITVRQEQFYHRTVEQLCGLQENLSNKFMVDIDPHVPKMPRFLIYGI